MGAFKEQGLDSTKIDESTGTVQMDNNVLFAWDKADIKTADAWNRYMADFAQKVRNPLTVKVN